MVGENILESFFLIFGSYRARMQRRGHTGRAHYKPARRTYVRPPVAVRIAEGGSKGGVWGGREPPPAFPTGSLLDSLFLFEQRLNGTNTNVHEYERKRISERTSLKDRKRTCVRKCTSDVRNHFSRPIYKRPEILSNRIISAPNLGTFGLIRRKVAFFVFLAVRMVVGANILDVR